MEPFEPPPRSAPGSTKVAVVQWLRMQVLGMEVPGLNSGKLFLTFFCTPFLPVVTALLKYLDPMIYICVVFAL